MEIHQVFMNVDPFQEGLNPELFGADGLDVRSVFLVDRVHDAVYQYGRFAAQLREPHEQSVVGVLRRRVLAQPVVHFHG